MHVSGTCSRIAPTAASGRSHVCVIFHRFMDSWIRRLGCVSAKFQLRVEKHESDASSCSAEPARPQEKKNVKRWRKSRRLHDRALASSSLSFAALIFMYKNVHMLKLQRLFLYVRFIRPAHMLKNNFSVIIKAPHEKSQTAYFSVTAAR